MPDELLSLLRYLTSEALLTLFELVLLYELFTVVPGDAYPLSIIQLYISAAVPTFSARPDAV